MASLKSNCLHGNYIQQLYYTYYKILQAITNTTTQSSAVSSSIKQIFIGTLFRTSLELYNTLPSESDKLRLSLSHFLLLGSVFARNVSAFFVLFLSLGELGHEYCSPTRVSVESTLDRSMVFNELQEMQSSEPILGEALVNSSLERAKQNSVDALSHRGRRNGAVSNRDSALINDENECKLLQDYKQ